MTRAREPIFNVPAVILIVSALLAGVHVALGALSEERQYDLILDFAFIPAREASWIDPNILASLANGPPIALDDASIVRHQLAVYLYAHAHPHPWTFVTYAALHVGYLHLLLNLIVLLAIGTPVARRLGVVRFLALFIAGAVGGALMNLAIHLASVAPLMGASAAISACWGAAARFAFDPRTLRRTGGDIKGLPRQQNGHHLHAGLVPDQRAVGVRRQPERARQYGDSLGRSYRGLSGRVLGFCAVRQASVATRGPASGMIAKRAAMLQTDNRPTTDAWGPVHVVHWAFLAPSTDNAKGGLCHACRGDSKR